MKKRVLFVLLAMVIAVCGAAFAACTGSTEKFTVTFYESDKTTEITSVSVESGKTVTAPEYEKAGYTVSWSDAEGNAVSLTAAITADTAFYAVLTAKEDTAYTVEHYFEKLDGTYELDAALTENLTGTTDATATATAKEVAHYAKTANENELLSGAIKGDGSLVLKVYYALDTFTVKFMDGATEVDSTSVKYGATVTAPEYEKAGYTVSWNDAEGNAADFTAAITADTVFNAVLTAKDDTAYTVEHYFEKLDGTYELNATLTENLTGTTDATATATAKEVAHYAKTANENELLSGAIKGDGSLVLKVYYALDTFTVKFMADQTEVDSVTVKYGAAVAPTANEVPVKDMTVDKMYTLKYWSATQNGSEYNFNTAVESNLTLYAVYEETTRTYALDVTLFDNLYYLVDESGNELEFDENFDLTAVPYGTQFKFGVELMGEAVGTPAVTAINTDDAGVETETAIEAAGGLYTVTVSGATKIVISGIAARTYTVKTEITELYNTVEFIKPYANQSMLVTKVTPAGQETAVTFENAIANDVATFELTAGVYQVVIGVNADNGSFTVLSDTITIEVSRAALGEGEFIQTNETLMVGQRVALDKNSAITADGKLSIHPERRFATLWKTSTPEQAISFLPSLTIR